MPTTNPTALVEELYGCFGRGDIPGLLERLAPDCEWKFVGDRKSTYTGTARGREAIGRWFGLVASHDEIQQFEPRSMLAGPDHVTVVGFERTLDRNTGRPFESEWVHVWRFADDRVTSFFGMLDSEASSVTRP